MSKDTQPITSGHIIRLLAEKYSLPAWAFITEVPNGTSFNKTRSLDAMAFGCWKSEGLGVIGFEIKVSRSDWTRELQDPTKALAFTKYCHQFFIVAPKGVVSAEELPREWGLITATDKAIKIASAASMMKPEPMPLNFVSAMLRKLLTIEANAERNSEVHRKAYEKGRKSRDFDVEQAGKAAARLEKQIAEFEAASGIVVNRWHGESLKRENEQFEKYKEFMGSRQYAQKHIHSLEVAINNLKFTAEALLGQCGEMSKVIDGHVSEVTE